MIVAGYMGAVSVVTTVKWFWFLFGMVRAPAPLPALLNEETASPGPISGRQG
jgi:bacteriorhodopsin